MKEDAIDLPFVFNFLTRIRFVYFFFSFHGFRGRMHSWKKKGTRRKELSWRNVDACEGFHRFFSTFRFTWQERRSIVRIHQERREESTRDVRFSFLNHVNFNFFWNGLCRWFFFSDGWIHHFCTLWSMCQSKKGRKFAAMYNEQNHRRSMNGKDIRWNVVSFKKGSIAWSIRSQGR